MNRGVGAVEALWALVLAGLLATAALGGLAVHVRGSGGLIDRSEGLSTRRLAVRVLALELGAGVEGRDWNLAGTDSVRVRAFRGAAVVCVVGGAADLIVRYDGDRAPDPAKDSVLVLTADARWVPARLSARATVTASAPAAGSCPAVAGSLERWTLAPGADRARAVRLFESGVYGLSRGALRYRRGLGGRQPLTVERVDTAGSSIRPRSGGGLRIRIRTLATRLANDSVTAEVEVGTRVERP